MFLDMKLMLLVLYSKNIDWATLLKIQINKYVYINLLFKRCTFWYLKEIVRTHAREALCASLFWFAENEAETRKHIPFYLILFNFCGNGGHIFLYSSIWGWDLKTVLSLYQMFKTRYIIIMNNALYFSISMRKNSKFMWWG